MTDETTITAKTQTPSPSPETLGGKESAAFGISLRGWLALVFVITVCFMCAMGKTVVEPLYSLTVMVVSFYFGKMSQPQSSSQSTITTKTP